MGHSGNDSIRARGDAVVSRLLHGDQDEMLPYQLLQLVYAGYPADRIASLATAKREAAVRGAAWVISELGIEARSLTSVISPLISTGDRFVEVHALDAVAVLAADCDSQTLALAVALVDDSDSVVAKAAIRCTAMLPDGDLRRARDAIGSDRTRDLVDWLSRVVGAPDATTMIVKALGSDRLLERRFATAAAIRVAAHDPAALERATEVSDPEIKDLAALELKVRAIRESRRRA